MAGNFRWGWNYVDGCMEPGVWEGRDGTHEYQKGCQKDPKISKMFFCREYSNCGHSESAERGLQLVNIYFNINLKKENV